MRIYPLVLAFLFLGCIEPLCLDCDDANPCTHNQCVNGRCVSMPLNGPVHGCFGRHECMEFVCDDGQCIPLLLSGCCGNGACEPGYDHASCPQDCMPSCSDGVMNQGETGIDCGGPCIRCDDPHAVYINQLSDTHSQLRSCIANYTNAIEDFNSLQDLKALESEAAKAWGCANAVKKRSSTIQVPDGMDDAAKSFEKSLKLYILAFEAMANYIKTGSGQSLSLANEQMRESQKADTDFVDGLNAMIQKFNDKRRLCANHVFDEGEQAVDCGGICPRECVMSFNVTKSVRLYSEGVPSHIFMNVSAPAIDHPPHQRVLAQYFEPQPDGEYFDDEGNLYMAYSFDMPGYGVRIFEITQTVELSIVNPPAASYDDDSKPEYLMPNTLSPLSQDICQTAENLAEGAEDEHSKARAIVSWMVKNIEYEEGDRELGALSCFQRMRGACSEHADLFVSMARCLGIPARRVAGSLYNDSVLSGHAWAQYHDGAWIHLDPTAKDADKAFALQNRHIISCLGEGAYGCGTAYSYTYSGEAPKIKVSERIYLS